MGLLLPGAKTWNDQGVLAGGRSTQGTKYRGDALRAAVPQAEAIQYSDLMAMNQDGRRQVMRNKVVYVYHNVIDITGDNRTSEHRTFNAVEDAMEELAELVKHVHASLRVAQVIVTADHGFLYNARTLAEADLQPLPAEVNRVEESTLLRDRG